MERLTGTIVKSATDGDAKTYTARLWQSTEADRHGDDIKAADFTYRHYQENPVILLHHKHDQPVGRATRIWLEGEALLADFKLGSTATAREAAQLIADGVLSAVSVGFQRLKSGALDLLEISLVSVPANPSALILQRSSPEEPTMSEAVLKAPAKIDKTPPTYSLAKAMAGQSGIGSVDDGFERETSEELQRKTGKSDFQVPLTALLSTKAHATEPGAGAELTAISQRDDLYAEIGDAIRAAMVTGRAGVRTVVEENETANVPVMSRGLQPEWIAKDADAPESQAVFDAATVTPKHIGGLFEIRRSALNYASHPQIAPILQMDLRRAVAHELDRVVLIGSSATNALEPDGITSVVLGSGDLDSVDDILGFSRSVREYDESRGGEVRMITRQGVLDHYAQVPMGPGVTAAASLIGSSTLLGTPALTTRALPETGTRAMAIVGLFEEAMLFMFGPSMSVVMNPYGETFKSGGVQGRLIVDANVLIRSPGAFAHAMVETAAPAPVAAASARKGK